jgi:hypothetical protein
LRQRGVAVAAARARSGAGCSAMTTPHRVALCALVRTFSDPPEEAAFQLQQEARLALGVFLADEVKAAHSVREPTLPALLARLEGALGDAGTALGQARVVRVCRVRVSCVLRARMGALQAAALRALRWAPAALRVGCTAFVAIPSHACSVCCPLPARYAARSTWWRRLRASCAWTTCTPSSARCQRRAHAPRRTLLRHTRHGASVHGP